MRFANDVAEEGGGGVAMIEAFCDSVTKGERQLQWLLQAVECSRKKYEIIP